MEGQLEDFPTFFNVCENIAWTRQGDVIGWPPDSRGMWVGFAISASLHRPAETEVAIIESPRMALISGGIEQVVTQDCL